MAASEQPSSTFEGRHELYMDEVAPNIWLGEKRAAFDTELETLKRNNIQVYIYRIYRIFK